MELLRQRVGLLTLLEELGGEVVGHLEVIGFAQANELFWSLASAEDVGSTFGMIVKNEQQRVLVQVGRI